MGSVQAHLIGWGAHHPDGRLTNDELVARLDTTEAWIDERVGIHERRIVGPDDTVATMGAAALARACASAGIDVAEVDVVIGATSFDDHDMPAAAARIAHQAGSQAFTFDVRAACSGWLVALEVARSLLASGAATTVAVVASEHVTMAVDPTDRSSVVFFGDGAGAAIVRDLAPDRRGLVVVDTTWRSDNTTHEAVRVPHGGWFEMDAKVTRPWVEDAMVEAATELLRRHDLTGADVRALVCHQANLRLIERFAAAIGVAPDHHWHNVEWAGNTWAAGTATSLSEGLDAEAADLRPGDPVLLVAVGAGLNVVATLLRWTGP